ncbi:MAG: efflux RND transporter permease subunit, partial [Kiritimatiellae bacterium]|nr:efflux RND transporter permease subunit [Kiritimatiellia bacterium]
MSADASDELRGPIAWMTKNNVAANLLMLFFLVGGIFAFTSITQEVFPDLDENIVSISVSYPGASPEEVEKGIVLAVEEALTGIANVEEINSSANEGSASIRVKLLENADSIQAYQDIKSEIDRIRTFPENAERPEVTLQVHRREVLNVALYGDAPEKVLKTLAERVRDQLLEDPNITQVDVTGTRSLEISISVPQENLRRYNLTLQGMAAILGNASVDLPGGGLKTASGEILVRVTERKDYGQEFGRIPILTGADGAQVLLEDIATIDDGMEDSDVFATYNGKPSVMLEIYRVGEQTPIQVADATKACMLQIEKTLPDGIHMAIQRNMADTYWQRASLLLKNGAFGLVLVFLLLGSFLELRLAFWVMMGIPISFLGSLILMPLFGLTINMMTMFAYLLALGIVVDDAIVVGENVYRRHQEGESFLTAAIRGTIEVSSPVAFSILTNMVAFIPLMILPGMMGRVMGMIPVVVISVFLISWIECIFILPSHLGHHKDRPRTGLAERIHNRQKRFSAWFIHWVRDDYAPFLEKCLIHRYLVVAIA